MISAAEVKSEIDLARIMAEQAEMRQAGFVALERAEAENKDNSSDNLDVNRGAEMTNAEIGYNNEEVKRLREEMEIARQAWQKKKGELEGHKSIFRDLFIPEQNLGEFEKELTDLGARYHEARGRYEEIARTAKADLDINTPADITMDDIGILPSDEERKNDISVAKPVVDDVEITLTKEGGPAIEEVENFIEKVKKDCQELLDKSLIAFEKYPQLRDVSRSNYDNAVHLLKTEVVDSIILKDLQSDFERVFIGIWKDLIDVKNLEDRAVLDMEADEYIVINGHKKAVKVYDVLESKMTKEQVDLEKIGPKPGESVIAWTQRLTKFILKNALNNSLN